MSSASARSATIVIDGEQSVSGLWLCPSDPIACLTLAHGAGAGMTHQSMTALADGLAARGVATLRYNFPYMERGSKRPDSPPIAHAAVRAAAAATTALADGLPIFAGGRSFGGRMTSQAQAIADLANVRGLIFFAFPLHPAGKPGTERATHLADVKTPMLFLQGTRDELASLDLLRPIIAKLKGAATLTLINEADHSFHVPARSGRKDADALNELLDAARAWIAKQIKK